MRGKLLPIVISIFISAIFFYQIFLGKLPFPGDLLVGNYQPYVSLSYANYVPGSIPNKAQGPDVIKELLPWKKFAVESLKKLQIPFWDPYNFSGNPLMANFQSAIFYPGNAVFFILNFSRAWTIYIILQPILAMFFTYLFLRRLKLGVWPALLGGLSFAFSLYMSVWMEYGNIGHTFLWLPLVLYFSDKLLEKSSRINFAGIVLASFFAALGGYIQGLFYIYAIVLIYFFAKGYFNKTLNVRKAIIFLLSLTFPILLSSFQLLPTLQLFKQSTRGNYSLEQIKTMLNPVYYLVTVVVPDFFGNPAARNYWFNGTYIERVSYFGLIPFVFAILAIATIFKKIEVKIFAVLFVFSAFISTDFFITRFFYLIPIPVLSTTVATRILSIFAFSGSILAGYGFNQVLESKEKRRLTIICSALFVFLACLFVFVILYSKIVSDPTLSANFNIAKRNIVIPFTIFLIFAASTFYYISNFAIFKKYKKTIYILAIFVATSFELFYYFQKITPFAPQEYLYPQTPVISFLQKNAGINRFWGYGSGYIESNFQTYDGTFSTEGNDPLHIKNYTELLAASKTGYLPEILPRPDANIAGGFGKEDLANNPYRQKVLNITGVSYVLNKDEGIRGDYAPDYITFPENTYKLVWQNGFWQAYQNLRVTPRILITNEYSVAPSKSRALRILFSSNFDESKKLVLYEDPKIAQGELNATTTLVSYGPDKVQIKTKSSAPALLYLSDNYYPGWQAFVDGNQTKIYLADYTFRAVSIPSGAHEVIFKFVPKSFYYGLWISAGALFLLIIFVFGFIKKNEK